MTYAFFYCDVNSNTSIKWLHSQGNVLSVRYNTRHMSQHMRFPTMWYVQPAKPQISLRCTYAQSDQSLCFSLEYPMSNKLLNEHHLRFLSLKGGCRGSSESTLVKMPHCWKSRVVAQYYITHPGFTNGTACPNADTGILS